MRKGAEKNVMVEVNYRQGRDGTSLDTVVQDLYLCASMEFLLTVADVFLKAMDQGFSSHPKSSKPASTSTKDSSDFLLFFFANNPLINITSLLSIIFSILNTFVFVFGFVLQQLLLSLRWQRRK